MTFNSSNYNFQYYQYGVDITKSDLTVDSNSNFALNKFNEIDLALTFGLLELNKNTALMSQVVTKIRNTNQKFYSVRQLAQDYPAFNTILDSVFSSNFNDFSTTWQDYVDIHYQYDIAYEPYLSFANYHYNNIDFEKQLFIAAPLEISNPDIVNDNLYPDNDDVLPMWILDSGSYKLTTIDFELGKVIDHPVILVGNGYLHSDPYETFIPIDGPYLDGGGSWTPPVLYHTCNNPVYPHEKIVFKKYKISTLHDKSNRAEVSINAFASMFSEPVSGTYIFREVMEHSKNHLAYDYVKKSELNTWINKDLDAFSRNVFFADSVKDECFHLGDYGTSKEIHFMTYAYEFDWWVQNWKVAGKIAVLSGSTFGSFSFNRKMRFASDWYFFGPGSDNDRFLYSTMPSSVSSHTFNGSGEAVFERKYGL